MFAMMGLAYIVIRSLITNQIQEREYDNAMLRTLGWNKSHIVFQTGIKIVIMFVIPGFIVGMGMSIGTTYAMGDILKYMTKTTVVFKFGLSSVWVGLAVAILLPIVSLIRPMMQSLTIQLRDSLDIFRNKVETFTVVFTKIQD
jgi:ABC-type lipoprotein release transport system permease subunit